MKFKNVILVVVIFSLGSCGLLTAGQKKIVIKNAAVVVKAKYPVLQSPKNQKIIQNFIYKQINDFQNAYPVSALEYKHKLKISYKVYNSLDYKSIVFKLRFFEENILENMFLKSFVFNIHNENLLRIADFFAEDIKLSLLASHAQSYFKEQVKAEYYDKDRVLRATAPKLSNFKNFYFDKGRLHILFNPFQVANFEAGYFDLVVPKNIVDLQLQN